VEKREHCNCMGIILFSILSGTPSQRARSLSEPFYLQVVAKLQLLNKIIHALVMFDSFYLSL
jgi:hypothetical protein